MLSLGIYYQTSCHMIYISDTYQSLWDWYNTCCNIPDALPTGADYIKRRKWMKEMIYVLIFIGIYLLLQIYILPRLGIST